jgi:ComF family protein
MNSKKNELIAYFEGFLSLFFPRVCASCGNVLLTQEEVICIQCALNLPLTHFEKETENPLSRIFWGRVPISSATSYLYYSKGGSVQQLLHQLKYKGKKEIGHFLGRQFGQILQQSELYSSISIIIPVPLHPKKEKKRGFNQSRIIAEGMAESMNISVTNEVLIRKSFSETQTRKSKFDRWTNVSEIFDIKNYELIKDQEILLIDDVITTGSTIESCAHALHKGSPLKIYIASLACVIN